MLEATDADFLLFDATLLLIDAVDGLGGGVRDILLNRCLSNGQLVLVNQSN